MSHLGLSLISLFYIIPKKILSPTFIECSPNIHFENKKLGIIFSYRRTNEGGIYIGCEIRRRDPMPEAMLERKGTHHH